MTFSWTGMSAAWETVFPSLFICIWLLCKVLFVYFPFQKKIIRIYANRLYTCIFVLFQMSYLVFTLVAFKPQNKINNFKIKTSFLLQRNVVFSNKKKIKIINSDLIKIHSKADWKANREKIKLQCGVDRVTTQHEVRPLADEYITLLSTGVSLQQNNI